jgi:outer membrane protein OmpA-like peptidoglycan-associated protein
MRLLFAISLFFPLLALSQKGNPEKAQKIFEEGLKAEKERNLDKAILLYEKSISEYPLAEAHHKLGGIYAKFFREQQEKIIFHYQKCLQISPENTQYQELYLFLSEMNCSMGKYDEAQKLASNYLAKFKGSNQKYAEKIVAMTKFAKEAISKPVSFNPITLKSPLNRFDQQDFPTLTADKKTMYFTGIGSANGDENLFVSRWIAGAWTEPEYIQELNTSFNEGTCAISADGKTLVFAACDGRAGRKNLGSCDLYISKIKNGVWEKPKNLDAPINSEFWESQPSLSADGRLIFFVSDSKRGGKGGRDIFWSQMNDSGKWSVPQCLDSTINTSGNEISPFLHPNGSTLFFASDGHIGMGGYDLFKSELIDGKWQKPQNLGFPINNHLDQVSLFITADGSTGYYAQEVIMPSKKASHKLAYFEIPQEIKIKRKSDYVWGKVYDAQTQQVLEAKIELRDLKDNELISSTTSTDGNYLIVLTQGAHYALHVSMPQYLFESLTFDYQTDTALKAIEINIPLKKIEIGSKVTLNNIFFKSGSYQLMENSFTELEKLFKFMSENEKINVEISGHTDNIGKEEANLTLSQQRAQSVVSYLLSKGLDASRISAKGYGPSHPLAENTTERGRALNRRIEFKILSHD